MEPGWEDAMDRWAKRNGWNVASIFDNERHISMLVFYPQLKHHPLYQRLKKVKWIACLN